MTVLELKNPVDRRAASSFQPWRVHRQPGEADRRVVVRGVGLGGAPVFIAGPCAVEDPAQLDTVAAFLAQRGVRLLRGGAFKPRTSPYDFQGLGVPGLELLSATARAHGMAVVTEIVDPRHLDAVVRHADLLQVGARNMQNFALLKAVGEAGKPVLLKRGLAATINEWLAAAEYIAASGNDDIVLCERGIRTFEPSTRNTLDVSAIAIARRETALPVIADVTHAAGRRDIQPALARAALAAGAQGVMVEVHPCPERALSDRDQQLDFAAFDALLAATASLCRTSEGSA